MKTSKEVWGDILSALSAIIILALGMETHMPILHILPMRLFRKVTKKIVMEFI